MWVGLAKKSGWCFWGEDWYPNVQYEVVTLILSFWKHRMEKRMREFSLLINVFANILWFLYVSLQSQPLRPTLQSQLLAYSSNSSPSVPAPFSCKTSIATCLSLRSQHLSHKHLVRSPQLQRFSPKPSVANSLSVILFVFSSKTWAAIIQSQPFSSNSSISVWSIHL